MSIPATRTLVGLVAAVVAVVLAVGAWLVFAPGGTGRAQSAMSPDGQVTLQLPAAGTEVAFTARPEAKETLNRTAYGFSALGDPVDVHATSGALPPDTVTAVFTYDPAGLPAGVTPANLGLAVYDAGLESWVPVLGSRVDERAHTIAALVPHFSLLARIFLDPAKAVVNLAGRNIRTTIDGTVGIAVWYAQLLGNLSEAFLRDLFAAAPALTCESGNPDVSVRVESVLNRLTACVQPPGADRNATVQVRNGYGYPVVATTLPEGITVTAADVDANGDDVAGLIRSAVWARLGGLALSGAHVGSLTTTPALKTGTAAGFVLDRLAVEVDLGLAALTVIAPESAAPKAAVKSLLKSMILEPSKVATPKGALKVYYDFANCVAGIRDATPANLLSMEAFRFAGTVAHDCLGTILQTLELKSALGELLGVVKVIPERLHTMTAELTYLQTFGVVNTLVSTMRFAVFDPAAAFRPYVGTWQLSTYKLTVTPDLTGEQVMYSSRPCQDGAETMCTVRYRLKFAVNRDGTVQGTYTRLRYVNKAGKEYSPFDTGLSIYEGLTFNLRAAGPNRLAVALDDPDDLLGFGFYCGAGATAAERQSCGVTGGQLYG